MKLKVCPNCGCNNNRKNPACVLCGFLFSAGAGASPTPQEFASSAGSPSGAPSVQQAKRGMSASAVSKPSHVKAEGEPDDLSRLVRLPVSELAAAERKLNLELLYKADLFDYLCWLETRHTEEVPALKGCDYVVMASDKTTCWGKTYADAVKVAMNHDKGIEDSTASAPQRSGGERRKANDRVKQHPQPTPKI